MLTFARSFGSCDASGSVNPAQCDRRAVRSDRMRAATLVLPRLADPATGCGPDRPNAGPRRLSTGGSWGVNVADFDEFRPPLRGHFRSSERARRDSNP